MNLGRMRAVFILSETSALLACCRLPPQGLGAREGERTLARRQRTKPLAPEACAGQDICPYRLPQSWSPSILAVGCRQERAPSEMPYNSTSGQPHLLLELVSSTVVGIRYTSLGQVVDFFFIMEVIERTTEKRACKRVNVFFSQL